MKKSKKAKKAASTRRPTPTTTATERAEMAWNTRSHEGVTVTLDEESSALVRWYANAFGREMADVASAAVMGQFSHARQEYEEGEEDNVLSGIADDVARAASRRIAIEQAVKNFNQRLDKPTLVECPEAA